MSRDFEKYFTKYIKYKKKTGRFQAFEADDRVSLFVVGVCPSCANHIVDGRGLPTTTEYHFKYTIFSTDDPDVPVNFTK